jgi:hypothetical protein
VPENLFDYLIRRNKVISLKDIYEITRDLLFSLQHLHSQRIYHLGLNPFSLQVLQDLQTYFDNQGGEANEETIN